MPRQVRVEFPGAIYHCMARGDRREPIVANDADRDAFARLLRDLMGRTGWEMFAWVLMPNHYHLVFRTPEPNLVAGMKWLQNTWTKRFNARHGLWGHVFGGRYKSILVQGGSHLAVLIDYVHLNPYRAGLVAVRDGLDSYRWSSLPDYVKPARTRSGWVRVQAGLAERGYRDDRAAERRRYLRHLEEVAAQHAGLPQLPDKTECSLQSTLRRGWYFGTESFRETMLERLDKLRGREAAHRPSSGYSGVQARDHSEATADLIIREGLRLSGIDGDELPRLPKGDWRKRVIAIAVRKNTSVPLKWIARELSMGDPRRVSTLSKNDPGPEFGADLKRAAKLLADLEEMIGRDRECE